jgi:exo-beta-1,3-glucanase (GH17 family)
MDQSQVISITPGIYVINKLHKDWGIGQVQSSINEKITINFEHVGKKVININEVPLEIVNTKIQNEFS